MNSKKIKKSEIIDKEIEELEKRVKETYNMDENSLIKVSNHFKDLPLSEKTKKGLKESRFFVMTPIQKATLN
jgi:superfamily II DNA/RNA helicase